MTAVVSTMGYFPIKVVSRAKEDFTIVQSSNYNVRVLEHCTRMCPPAIIVTFSLHHE